MKKVMAGMLLILAVALLSLPAWARCPNCPMAGGGNVSSEESKQFFQETEPIRKSICEKQQQVNELISKPESDPAQIGALEKEIHELRGELREKAAQAGIACPGWGQGPRHGGGKRLGCGGCL